MATQWIVLLRTSAAEVVPYGPFDDKPLADLFADFLTEEVDPACVMELRSPVREQLCFWSCLPTDRRSR